MLGLVWRCGYELMASVAGVEGDVPFDPFLQELLVSGKMELDVKEEIWKYLCPAKC